MCSFPLGLQLTTAVTQKAARPSWALQGTGLAVAGTRRKGGRVSLEADGGDRVWSGARMSARAAVRGGGRLTAQLFMLQFFCS